MNKQKILIACSGGPDSMALLNMYKDKKCIYVCHINYHQRPTANRDENIVKKYCTERCIPFFKFDYIEKKKGNFQKLARDFRYKCFREVCFKNGIKIVYVAHHMDDHIETYYMQLKRKTSVSYYGISKRINLDGLIFYRPLLNKTKSQLLDYVNKNNIPYGIDESNATDKYERNRIRHHDIDKLSYKEKLEVVEEIKLKNNSLRKEINDTNDFIHKYIKYPYIKFLNFDYYDRLIRLLLFNNLSSKYISEIKKALSSRKNIELKIKNKIICREYGYIYVYDNPINYEYKIYDYDFKKYRFFKISKKGNKKEGVCIEKDDFPLTIRNYKKGDVIKMNYGSKKINRFFIDNKISSYDRKIWPIVLNNKGNIILVPGIGCDKYHYSIRYNLYVLKLS